MVAHQWAIQGSNRVVVHSRTVDDTSIGPEGVFADRKWELMDARPVSLATVYAGWEEDRQRIVASIAPRTDEELALRAAPYLRTIGHLARTWLLHVPA